MPFSLPVDGNQNPVPALRPISTERISISNSAALTTAVTEDTILRVISEADCFIAVGSSPTANTTTSLFLPAKTPEYIKLVTGDRISAILSSGSSFLYATTVR